MDLSGTVERLLGERPATTSPMSGGDLSALFRVTLASGRAIVAKQGSSAAREARMLAAIRATGAPAPEILGIDSDWLLLELLPGSSGVGPDAWPPLAIGLRKLHSGDARSYGWPEDHAFGHIAIANAPKDDWPQFWADNRLRCHLPHLAPDLARRVEQLAMRIPELLPARPRAALLHGDLWGGNVMTHGSQLTGLIDPACYHGDREVDVAMLTLFDVPPPHFLDALYLDPGWRERLPVYRLWPLLVHLRLFGNSYAGSVAFELQTLGF